MYIACTYKISRKEPQEGEGSKPFLRNVLCGKDLGFSLRDLGPTHDFRVSI